MLLDFRDVPCKYIGTHSEYIGSTLHSMIMAVGHEKRIRTPYSWHGMKRGNAEFTILQYTLDGEGSLDCEGQHYKIKPGQAMILSVPHDHHYWLPENGKWHFFFVSLYGTEVVRHWRHVINLLGPVQDMPLETGFIQSAASLCTRLIQGEKLTAAQASAEAYGLTMQLLDIAHSSDRRPRTVTRSPDIQRSIDFCRANLSKDIGVDDMAAVTGYSRYHFSRRFAQSEGCAPGEFISRERIRLAVRLLQTTDTPITLLATQCGYKDASYFCRVFRKMAGMSPGDLRRSGMTG